jgi:ketosteroid isomerase-like protein
LTASCEAKDEAENFGRMGIPGTPVTLSGCAAFYSLCFQPAQIHFGIPERKRMRQILLCLALAISLFSQCLAQTEKKHSVQDSNLKQALIQLKHDIGQAYVKRDIAALERLYADDYTVTDESGETTNKTQEIDRLRSGNAFYESTSYEDVKVRIYDKVAIVAGRGTVKGRGKNGAFHKQYFSTNVFIQDKGVWRAVSAHISGVKDL